MTLFKEEGVIELEDADPTIIFIMKIGNVARIMNAKTPGDALKWNLDETQVILLSIFYNLKKLILYFHFFLNTSYS